MELTFATMAPDDRQRRLRWRSRRALLELDLYFERFWQRQQERSLDEASLAALETLLAMEDHELWALISGRETTADLQLMNLVERLRTA